MDQLDLLAGQGTFQSLLQHYNLKASILWVLVFFLDKAEEPGIKLPTSAGSWKKQESSRKRIQNDDSEDDLGSPKKNGEDTRNVLRKLTTKEFILSNCGAAEGS